MQIQKATPFFVPPFVYEDVKGGGEVVLFIDAEGEMTQCRVIHGVKVTIQLIQHLFVSIFMFQKSANSFFFC